MFGLSITEKSTWKSPQVLQIFQFLFVVLSDFCLKEVEAIFLDTFTLTAVITS